jgi:gluconolactonase
VRPPSIYRVDPGGKIDAILEGKPGLVPNGIAFSPDYRKVYFVWGANIDVADVAGTRIANQRTFSDGMVDGVKCGFDGHRVDNRGNVWSGSTSVPGYMGVTVWNPAGKLIGRIRLPETCANITFCGPKRDWLWMCASQSVYLVRTNVQGAAPA